jgi:hypothetical protein
MGRIDFASNDNRPTTRNPPAVSRVTNPCMTARSERAASIASSPVIS